MPAKSVAIIATSQYENRLNDPGGLDIFPAVLLQRCGLKTESIPEALPLMVNDSRLNQAECSTTY